MVCLNFIVSLLIIVIVPRPDGQLVAGERNRGAHDALLVITLGLHQPMVMVVLVVLVMVSLLGGYLEGRGVRLGVLGLLLAT